MTEPADDDDDLDPSTAEFVARFREDYLSKLPSVVPVGKWLVHNRVRPRRRLGTAGSRAWLSDPDPRYVICDCGWAPELGTHYRVDGIPTRTGW